MHTHAGRFDHSSLDRSVERKKRRSALTAFLCDTKSCRGSSLHYSLRGVKPTLFYDKKSCLTLAETMILLWVLLTVQ